MKHYHSDGAIKLIGTSTTDYFDNLLGALYSCSPRGTPTRNCVSELKNITHNNKMTLCILTRSG